MQVRLLEDDGGIDDGVIKADESSRRGLSYISSMLIIFLIPDTHIAAFALENV